MSEHIVGFNLFVKKNFSWKEYEIELNKIISYIEKEMEKNPNIRVYLDGDFYILLLIDSNCKLIKYENIYLYYSNFNRIFQMHFNNPIVSYQRPSLNDIVFIQKNRINCEDIQNSSLVERFPKINVAVCKIY
jgi:hypothetical protein